MKRILLIEDNLTKSKDIKELLNDIFANLFIKHTDNLIDSFEILSNEKFDFIILDMSLPMRNNYSSYSNNFESLAGYKILNEMKRKNKKTPTILVTMFSEFGVNKSFMNVEDLNNDLDEKFGDFYKGYIFYSSRDISWKEKLTKVLNNEDFNS